MPALSSAAAAPTAPESLRSTLERLAEHLRTHRLSGSETDALRIALVTYARAAVAGGLTERDATRIVEALVRSVAVAQGWSLGSAGVVAARLARLVEPTYAADVLPADAKQCDTPPTTRAAE
jgi:hypothetical protein